ncbi:MAG: glycosyltransferase [Pelagibacteraceae bacterium]|nr:glycosyltransferase [Pelagibacteraceae bacterium]
MKISYCITVCTELVEIHKLLHLLVKNKREEDEIVIVRDSKNGSDDVLDYLYSHSLDFHQYSYEFDGDFSALKNYTKSKCRNDYIVHLDADEVPHETLMEQLPQIIEMNDVDLIWIPRVNTVDGITDEHIKQWGWRVSEKGWINFPDYQSRCFKNVDHIRWEGKVHERITGCKTYAHLPPHEELSLYHPKTIDKQEMQNELYTTIQTRH